MGKDFMLLQGFLEYKAEFYTDAVDDLKGLAEDEAFAKARPELFYYLGRAHYANASYGKAVAALERFIDLQSALDRPLLPASASDPRLAADLHREEASSPADAAEKRSTSAKGHRAN
jgi:uncharacterized protein HemY